MKKERLIIGLILISILFSTSIYALTLSVNSPESRVYPTSNLLVNFSASDSLGIDSLWFFNGTGNTTLQSVKQIFSQTVNENNTAQLNCSGGYVISSYQSNYAINCNATPCGSCTLGSSTCAVFFGNSVCGDSCSGTLKQGQLNITCSKLNEDMSVYKSFSDGSYNFLFYAKNTQGTKRSDSVNFSIDMMPPNISTQAANPACAYNYSNINLNATISDLNLQSVWISGNWENTWKNYTPICSGIQERACIYTIEAKFLQNGESFSWQYYARDSAGNLKVGNLQTYTLNKRTSLVISPVSPDGLNNWYVTEPLFSLINPDASQIRYRWDSVGTHGYTAPFNLTDIPNPPSETAGILKLTYWSNTSCGIEQEQSKTLYIDLKNPVLKNYIPANKAIIVNRNPEISVVIDEVYGSNSGINKNSVGMKLDNVSVARVISDMSSMKVKVVYGALNMSSGGHIVEVFGQDNSGRQFYGSWSFTINSSVSLSLNVFFPQNLNYSSKQVLFNLSTNNLASMQYYENGKLKTLCTKCISFAKKLSFSDGLHNLTIKASDSYGNSEEKRVSFIVDSTKPKIIKTEPEKNSVTNGSEFFIKYTEENLKSIKLVFKTSVNITKTCEGGINKNCTFSANLTEQNGNFLDYYFEVSDGINIVNSKETRVKVDTVSPVINSINKTIKKSSIKLKVNITEENFDVLEYYDNNDGRARWKSLCSSLKNGICEKEVTFKGSAPSILLRAIDDAGNSVQTRTLFSI